MRKAKSLFLYFIVLFAVLMCSGFVGASDFIEAKKLLASDGQGFDNFGYSVSISGDLVVVGAYGDDDNGSESGSAYLFHQAEDFPWEIFYPAFIKNRKP